ncbi:aminotransferase-like domain-containing protein [Actinokineospora diospyrosa]|uniref:DNA-binding transcriptional regulator, MocR family, contains an aminotransferase domain n=1 Tax=Actinokineospora diospyrosa TaxID=103728 RepID=A0ABT1IGH6_9PSEU|nr:PLP-dependent aminotransferase family protein [Actinokineospora diospyrosa]MCP2271747.1 DNA-binding transcriptional regulator, MocR family, contains an aminotransferase domain [Actinokineospora diospyrosa]
MDFRTVADRIAQDIATGRLGAGTRLPTQRQFARQHGLAVSTASRVYAELVRRGLVVGEVGRGTFVRAAPAVAESALAEPGGARVDLELNFPILPHHIDVIADSMRASLRPDVLASALRSVGAAGTPAAREAAVGLLSRGGWAPRAEDVVFAGNGRQAIAGAVAALVAPGERLGVEEVTYAVVKGIAARLGVVLVPLATDSEGVTPAALRSAGPLSAVYLQPALHNPLGISMSATRRQEVADVLLDKDIPLIEDAIYGFLHDDPPLWSLVSHGVLVDSLSKRIAPGLSVGFAVTTPSLRTRVTNAIRSGGWAPQHVAVAAMIGWATDGTADRLLVDKRADARARQALVAEHLAGFDVQADPRAYHLWWRLPDSWRADTFVATAARAGIAITPGTSFAVPPTQAPRAVRLAIGSPPLPALAAALAHLADLAANPDPGLD